MHGKTGKPQTIHDIIPDGMFVGVGLILRDRGRLLYGIRPPRAEGGRQILELTGIGGGMESHDATLTAGVQRESWEEMGCGVRLLLCDETVVARGEGLVERVRLDGAERPCAVVFRRYRTPAHHPWDERNQGKACLVVFLAEVDGEPRPSAELPGLIWLSPEQAVQAAREDMPLRALLEGGATLMEQEAGALPSDAWTRLTDSQEALVLALGEEALGFYRGLAGV